MISDPYILKRRAALEAFVTRHVEDEEARFDILQDVVVKALIHRDFLSPARLGRKMTRWAKDGIKAHQRRENRVFSKTPDSEVLHDPLEIMLKEDLIRFWHQRALNAISCVEGEAGKAFQMLFLERLTLEEVARALGYSKEKTRGLANLGLAEVRTTLRKSAHESNRYWLIGPLMLWSRSLFRKKPAWMASFSIILVVLTLGTVTLFTFGLFPEDLIAGGSTDKNANNSSTLQGNEDALDPWLASVNGEWSNDQGFRSGGTREAHSTVISDTMSESDDASRASTNGKAAGAPKKGEALVLKPYKYYDEESGHLVEEGFFDQNRRWQKERRKYFRDTGKLYDIAHFDDDGRMHGLHRIYRQDGRLRVIETWTHGVKERDEVLNRDGRIYIVREYENGELVGETRLD